jgi:hypothetical protein
MNAEWSGDTYPLTVSHQLQVPTVLSPKKWLLVSAESQTVCVTEQVWTQQKVKVKFALEQATKAQRGSRGIALLFL